jgi:hypothetical protein
VLFNTTFETRTTIFAEGHLACVCLGIFISEVVSSDLQISCAKFAKTSPLKQGIGPVLAISKTKNIGDFFSGFSGF